MIQIPEIKPEEYLHRERVANIRSEYIDKEIYAMAGASREHNLIATNVIRIPGNQLVDAVLPLEAIPCELPFSQLYRSIDFLPRSRNRLRVAGASPSRL